MSLTLKWPTEYRTITQQYGARPEYYKQFGLKGHEGIDFRAPEGSKIFSCTDGTVVLAQQDDGRHPYGTHIRVQYGPYTLVYAHLSKLLVSSGDDVKAGQIIGLAGNTGNSSGAHLHLTLLRDGFIVDPTPLLENDMRVSLNDNRWTPVRARARYDTVNLRDRPWGSIIDQLPNTWTRARILEEEMDGDWLPITIDAQTLLWVHNNYVITEEIEPTFRTIPLPEVNLTASEREDVAFIMDWLANVLRNDDNWVDG